MTYINKQIGAGAARRKFDEDGTWVIPSVPGFRAVAVLAFDDGGNEPTEFLRLPVVAWQLLRNADGRLTARPVVPDCIHAEGVLFVETDDGALVEVGEGVFTDLAAAREAVARRGGRGFGP
jgi:hypothetical protein